MFCCLKSRKYSPETQDNSSDKSGLRNGNVSISEPMPLEAKDGGEEVDMIYENQNQVSNTNLEQLAELSIKSKTCSDNQNLIKLSCIEAQKESGLQDKIESSVATEKESSAATEKESSVATEKESCVHNENKICELGTNDNSVTLCVNNDNCDSKSYENIDTKAKNSTAKADNSNEKTGNEFGGTGKNESSDDPTSVYENYIIPVANNSLKVEHNSSLLSQTPSSFLQTANQLPDLSEQGLTSQIPETKEQLASQLESAQQEVATTIQEVEDFEFDEMSQELLNNAVSRLESVAARLESLSRNVGVGGSSSGGGTTEAVETGPTVMAYDEIINGPLANFIALSKKMDAGVQEMVNLVSQSFQRERDIIVTAAQSQKPSMEVMVEIFKPLTTHVTAVQSYREANRSNRAIENHLACLSESIGALGWVGVSPAPVPYIKEMQDSGIFYSNRILKEFKEKDPSQVEWVKAWNETLVALQAYVKQHHTTGLTWNPKGRNASAGSAPPPPPAGVPPPPPPAGLPPPPPQGVGAPASNKPDASALFSEINKGADISKGLKKVTDDMKTHKNPGLRQGPAPYKPPVTRKPVSAPTPAKPATVHPPVTKLEGKKWIVEYHNDNRNIVIDNTELKQTVYVYKCVNSTIQIKGKVNSVIMDSCKKCGVVFDDILASLEFVNCQSVQGQVIGRVPTVSIDKTDGCQVYLSKDSLDSEIVSAKSSEMNILVPTSDGDMKEFALPEQFKTSWNGSSFTTSMTESV